MRRLSFLEAADFRAAHQRLNFLTLLWALSGDCQASWESPYSQGEQERQEDDRRWFSQGRHSAHGSTECLLSVQPRAVCSVHHLILCLVGITTPTAHLYR